jgi:hypothetical protein
MPLPPLFDTITTPKAVALVDAFDIPDRVLNSTIGRHDGNVYEALYAAAKDSALNTVEPFEGFDELLRPRLDIAFLTSRNKPYAAEHLAGRPKARL